MHQIAKHFRPLYNGTLIVNSEFDQEKGNKILEEGNADGSYGKLYINPDLVSVWKIRCKISAEKPLCFWSKGSIDYQVIK
jgi:N-ethylmaleimide reductase